MTVIRCQLAGKESYQLTVNRQAKTRVDSYQLSGKESYKLAGKRRKELLFSVVSYQGTVNRQLTTNNCQLTTVNCQLITDN